MSRWEAKKRKYDQPAGVELGIVVTNGEVQLQKCSLYSHYDAVLNSHHVCPDSWWVHAGKDPNLSPMKDLCPNCHYNTHAAIDAIIKGEGVVNLPLRCVELAKEAFAIAQANGLTPAPTL